MLCPGNALSPAAQVKLPRKAGGSKRRRVEPEEEDEEEDEDEGEEAAGGGGGAAAPGPGSSRAQGRGAKDAEPPLDFAVLKRSRAAAADASAAERVRPRPPAASCAQGPACDGAQGGAGARVALVDGMQMQMLSYRCIPVVHSGGAFRCGVWR